MQTALRSARLGGGSKREHISGSGSAGLKVFGGVAATGAATAAKGEGSAAIAGFRLIRFALGTVSEGFASGSTTSGAAAGRFVTRGFGRLLTTNKHDHKLSL